MKGAGDNYIHDIQVQITVHLAFIVSFRFLVFFIACYKTIISYYVHLYTHFNQLHLLTKKITFTVLISVFRIDETIDFAGLVHMYMGILTTLSMETPLFSSCVFTGHQMASFGVWRFGLMPFCVRWFV